MEPTVRIAEAADLAGIVRVYNEAVAERAVADLEPVTEEARAGWFEAHAADRYPILVAHAGGDVRGWASLGEYRLGRGAFRATAEISYFVARAARRRGIASALVGEALDRAPGLGFEHLVALLLEGNAPSIALLRKFGFEEWGRMPATAHVDGRRLDHLYYGRHL